eukprot:scaffold14067_cov172-Amphora_coffeaeformis.AAC.2
MRGRQPIRSERLPITADVIAAANKAVIGMKSVDRSEIRDSEKKTYHQSIKKSTKSETMNLIETLTGVRIGETVGMSPRKYDKGKVGLENGRVDRSGQNCQTKSTE